MADYNERSVEDLKAEASERELEGRSKLTKKEDLVAALEADDASKGDESEDGASASEEQEELREELDEYVEERNEEEGDDRPTIGFESDASDPDNPVVDRAMEDKPEYEDLSEEDKELADLALDASGPLNVESPYGRIMTGAVSEEDAAEQEKEVGKLPEEYPKDLPIPERIDDNFVEEAKELVGRQGEYDDVQQEDVIDFPAAPHEHKEAAEARAAERRDEVNAEREEGYVDLRRQNVAETQGEEEELVAQWRPFDQRSVLYTDGVSGPGGENLERAYRVSDLRAGLAETNLHRRNPALAEEVEEAEEGRNEAYENDEE